MQFLFNPRAAEELQNLKSHFLCYLLGTFSKRYSARPVANESELDVVCRILYRQYRKKNFCAENESGRHFSPFMFAPDSRTFILRNGARTAGTVSIFPDSAHGIPSDTLFSEELNRFRRAGMRFAEVGLLALELEGKAGYSLKSRRKMLPLFMLFKEMFNYAMVRDLTHLMIMVHPRHAPLYSFFGFQSFAPVKDYPGACGNPALPLILDIKARLNSAPPSLKKFFLNGTKPAEAFDRQLCETPAAFASMFGDSYAAFEKTHRQLPVRKNAGSQLWDGAPMQ